MHVDNICMRVSQKYVTGMYHVGGRTLRRTRYCKPEGRTWTPSFLAFSASHALLASLDPASTVPKRLDNARIATRRRRVVMVG